MMIMIPANKAVFVIFLRGGVNSQRYLSSRAKK